MIILCISFLEILGFERVPFVVGSSQMIDGAHGEAAFVQLR